MAEESEAERMLRAQRELNSARTGGQPAKAGWRWWQITLAVLGGLVVLGLFVPDDTRTTNTIDQDEMVRAAASIDPEASATRVTATDLFNSYDANEAAAQQAYGGRSLLVTGTVASIDLDLFDEPIVLLRTPNEFMSAQASLTEEAQAQATGLRKGQAIELLCRDVSEVAGTPMLKDCDIR